MVNLEMGDEEAKLLSNVLERYDSHFHVRISFPPFIDELLDGLKVLL